MNKALLMGRLTKDPELRYTSTNNTAICSFTLAVDRRFNKQGEERQADFISIVTWSKLAEFCGKYFQKGLKVVVVGRIQSRTWDDNDGKKHYVTEVVGEEAYFADSKRGDGPSPKISETSQETTKSDSGQNEGFYPIEEEDDQLPF